MSFGAIVIWVLARTLEYALGRKRGWGFVMWEKKKKGALLGVSEVVGFWMGDEECRRVVMSSYAVSTSLFANGAVNLYKKWWRNSGF